MAKAKMAMRMLTTLTNGFQIIQNLFKHADGMMIASGKLLRTVGMGSPNLIALRNKILGIGCGNGLDVFEPKRTTHPC